MTDTPLGKAIEINPNYGKAYYRRGNSYLAILRPTDAVPDFKKALSVEPGNRAARDQLDATVKLIRRIAFEKASGHLPFCLITMFLRDICYPVGFIDR